MRDVHHTSSAFTNLAQMTQLTYLNFSMKGQHVQQDTLDEQLAALSTLTSLDILRCHLPCYAPEVVWSSQDQKYVGWPPVGDALKAALPQATSMSVFVIEA